MKAVYTTIIICFGLLDVYSQAGTMDYKQIAKLKDLTLQVVLDDNVHSTYNVQINECMKRYWTFNKYEFVKQKDILDLKANKDNYFLITWYDGGSPWLDDVITFPSSYIGIISPKQADLVVHKWRFSWLDCPAYFFSEGQQ